jgi:hypothetical protein
MVFSCCRKEKLRAIVFIFKETIVHFSVTSSSSGSGYSSC